MSLKKIIVFGNVGSGKSTISKKISKQHNLKYVEIDAIRWKKNWERVSDEEFFSKLHDVLKQDKWVIDDASKRTLNFFKDDADLIIYLQTNVFLCLFRVIKRSFKRWLGLDAKKGEPFIEALKNWRHCLRFYYHHKEKDFFENIRNNQQKLIIIKNNNEEKLKDLSWEN